MSILKNNYFVKHWWTAAFENPVYLNSTEQFPEFQSDEVNRKFIEQGMTDVVKILGFYGDRVFVFQVEAFQFSKFHEKIAKLDKGNFKRGLTVTFKVKNS